MARLHEYQGKTLLAANKISIPLGNPARSAAEARSLASEIGGEVVVKGQAWVTGRAGLGLIQFAEGPEAAFRVTGEILGRKIDNFTIDHVLIEEKLAVKREFYAGMIIDDQAQAPVMIFSSVGGTGIEDIAAENPEAVARTAVDIRRGFLDYQARELVRQTGIHGRLQMALGNILVRLYQVARKFDARSAEINPVVLTENNRLIAADCRITIDDYAVYRHPQLGIEIAREFDRPPTNLEMTAWQVEKNDYRGTFYFIQMAQDFQKGDRVIGFHGAGGGGSMMSMDAVLNKGYRLANFVDTSGNPPASKVYRAARLILAQEGIDGYFASGSGVASQEQFHSARGLVKAFLEEPLTVPAVIRMGGNAEARAIDILHSARPELSAPVEGYGKDDPPEFCAARLDALIQAYAPPDPSPPRRPPPTAAEPYTFETVTAGTVTLDHAACRDCESKICIDTCVPEILHLEDGVPVLNITPEAARKGGCIECLACEVECHFHGNKGGYVHLPIPGLEAV